MFKRFVDNLYAVFGINLSCICFFLLTNLYSIGVESNQKLAPMASELFSHEYLQKIDIFLEDVQKKWKATNQDKYIVIDLFGISDKKISTDAAKTLIRVCALFAMETHKDQFRQNGRPFYFHPFDVAQYLFYTFDVADPFLIAIAFLHDVEEDEIEKYQSIVIPLLKDNIVTLFPDLTDDDKYSLLEIMKNSISMITKPNATFENTINQFEIYLENLMRPKEMFSYFAKNDLDLTQLIRGMHLIKLSDILANAGELDHATKVFLDKTFVKLKKYFKNFIFKSLKSSFLSQNDFNTFIEVFHFQLINYDKNSSSNLFIKEYLSNMLKYLDSIANGVYFNNLFNTNKFTFSNFNPAIRSA